MQDLIPIKKDIVFKTRIGEITNIGLDYDYKINSDIVEGSIDISGSYKMLESSLIEEDFFYSIPFSVAISNDILKESISIDIDDFKYSFNKDILSVSVNLNFECEKEKVEDIMNDSMINDIDFNLDNNIDLNINNEDNIILNDSNIILENNDNVMNITNITNNLITNEKHYHTYKVYIVKQGDTYESISNKYNVSIENIKKYNSSINIGDKIIIPLYSE